MGEISRRTRIFWLLLAPALILTFAGLITMNDLSTTSDFFTKQLMWLFVAVVVYTIASNLDTHILRQSRTVLGLYIFIIIILGLLFVVGSVFKGAQSWFDLGFFAIQPADPAKIVLIALLAKYFSRRHIEMASIRHLVISGGYAAVLALLVFLQPDFGSMVIILCIWLGMVLVSGIPIKHLLSLAALAGISFILLWNFSFAEYQKDRIRTFLDPYADITGSGYNVYQSLIAVGSGGLMGRGYGEGTQSRLQFLPEYETDFIFAAFAEEWGFIGAAIVIGLFGFLIYQLVRIAREGESNFEVLFTLGIAIMICAHFLVHVGMNVALLPVTGTPLPFMSYGGSHLITEYLGIGLAAAMANLRRRQSAYTELLS